MSAEIICYICGSLNHSQRKGKVRDCKTLEILQCNSCGLVFLSSFDHINQYFYENSGMHSAEPISIDSWLKEAKTDDQRRFEMLKLMLPNKRLLDFGCGAAGFLQQAKNLAAEVTGIELETRVRDYWAGQIKIVPSVEFLEAEGGYDLITAFHVIEHLFDPRSMLTTLAGMLKLNGRMIVEVPNSEDALLNLYDCEAFQHFTYWSKHLYLFNSATLEMLARQAGLRVVAVKQYQRYPLSNHLYWLSQGKPGGHQLWSFLNTPEIAYAYANTLATLGKADTLIAHLERWD
jgi:2-polyprenyl-3-methyl-5-hydroxy-6-metoxy-1,4-benzoquinol methylase